MPLHCLAKILKETPPHTWRKLLIFIFANIDTWKHLHIRGENLLSVAMVSFHSRNTSTYVEKTRLVAFYRSRREKHLHIRGENTGSLSRYASCLETPPHTWRKLNPFINCSGGYGNTSTYVEKTFSVCWICCPLWKHLHIRGENSPVLPYYYRSLETPPHTWRKRIRYLKDYIGIGNTSTYVEKTCLPVMFQES